MRTEHRGGKRKGAGRKPEGKHKYTVTLDEENVTRAKALETNFSGLLDRLLAKWLSR
jgi:post-segregation antitoxin (ccd killing protein)